MRKKKTTIKSILAKYSTKTKIGKRQFKSASPYAVQVYLKSKNKLTPFLNKHLQYLRKELAKLKKKKIKNYSKAWQTRIKNQYKKLYNESAQIYEKINFVDTNGLPEFDMFEYMNGIDPNSGDSPLNKWKSGVDYYFNGDEEAAKKSYDLYAAFHAKK